MGKCKNRYNRSAILLLRVVSQYGQDCNRTRKNRMKGIGNRCIKFQHRKQKFSPANDKLV